MGLLRQIAAVALLLAASGAGATSIPGRKTDLRALPTGANPAKFIQAADINGFLDLLDGQVNLKNYGGVCDGSTDDYLALVALAASVGTTPKTLIVSGQCSISVPVSIPSTLLVKFEAGGAFVGVGAVTYTPLLGTYDVRSFGARCNGSVDDKSAFDAALAALTAAGGTLRVSGGAGSVCIYNGSMALPKGVRLVGDGDPSSNSSLAPTLKINAGTSSAITVTSGPATIENLIIQNNGGTGIGVRATRTLTMRNVSVTQFKKTNLLLEQDGTSTGPYYSWIEDCTFTFSDEPGAVVGNGANAVTILNSRFLWNGFVNHDLVTANNYDGLYVGASYNPNSVPVSAPVALTLSGGDASYNSQYGWHIENLVGSSHVTPGYAEQNHAAGSYQARVGNGVQRALVSFGNITAAQLKAEACFYRLTDPSFVFVGGTVVPQCRDNGDANGFYNLINVKQYLSSNGAGSNIVILTPDTTTGNLLIDPFGSSVLTLGHGTSQLQLSNGVVKTTGTFESTGQITADAGMTSPGNIATTGTGTITSAGLLTASTGVSSGGSVTMTSGNVLSTTGSNATLTIAGNRDAADSSVDILMKSTNSRSAGDLLSFRNGSTQEVNMGYTGLLKFPQACAGTGTPGAATCNQPAGRHAIAAGASTITITDDQATATSTCIPILQANDATCTFIKSCVPAAGSFVVTTNTTCTGNTAFGWMIFRTP